MNALFYEQRIERAGFISITPEESDEIVTVNAGAFQPDLYVCVIQAGYGSLEQSKAVPIIREREGGHDMSGFIEDTAVVLFGCDINAYEFHAEYLRKEKYAVFHKCLAKEP